MAKVKYTTLKDNAEPDGFHVRLVNVDGVFKLNISYFQDFHFCDDIDFSVEKLQEIMDLINK